MMIIIFWEMIRATRCHLPEDDNHQKILDPTRTRTPTPPSSSPYPVAIPTSFNLLFMPEERELNTCYNSFAFTIQLFFKYPGLRR
jgi:hypothetical protein